MTKAKTKSLSKSQLDTLERINGGTHSAPPLPRADCLELEDRGFAQNQRGRFYITPDGREAIEKAHS